VGGYHDIEALDRSGELDSLVWVQVELSELESLFESLSRDVIRSLVKPFFGARDASLTEGTRLLLRTLVVGMFVSIVLVIAMLAGAGEAGWPADFTIHVDPNDPEMAERYV
jgi:hypothetical protein